MRGVKPTSGIQIASLHDAQMGKPRKVILGITAAVAVGALVFWGGARLTSAPNIHSRASAAVSKSDSSAGSSDTLVHERKMLEAALQRKPDHKPLLFRLAQLAEESGQKKDAEKYLRAILRTEPDDADTQIELSKLLYDRGDLNGAIETVRHVLARQPDHPDALYNLGALYANLGNSEKARQCWSRLIATHPESDSAGRARQLLPRLGG